MMFTFIIIYLYFVIINIFLNTEGIVSMIYYYTSVNAFLYIIKTNKLRLMLSFHTNDPYECYWPKIVFELVCNFVLKDELFC